MADRQGDGKPFDAECVSESGHVVVCGNEKGGSGKTTTAIHIVVALLKAGFSVATIDLDMRQKSLDRHIANRAAWARKCGVSLELPTRYDFVTRELDSTIETNFQDFAAFVRVVDELERDHDFVVIDTPGSDSYLMRLAHSMADTLVTPLNDSFVDFDVLGQVDPENYEIEGFSHYASMVRDARRQRREDHDGLIDWVVVRNRVSPLASRNSMSLLACVKQLSMQLGFRIADGIGERMIFREYFPKGLTALDEFDVVGLEGRTTRSHLAARDEVNKLIRMLRLPIDAQSRKLALSRGTWLSKSRELYSGNELHHH